MAQRHVRAPWLTCLERSSRLLQHSMTVNSIQPGSLVWNSCSSPFSKLHGPEVDLVTRHAPRLVSRPKFQQVSPYRLGPKWSHTRNAARRMKARRTAVRTYIELGALLMLQTLQHEYVIVFCVWRRAIMVRLTASACAPAQLCLVTSVSELDIACAHRPAFVL
eukprot:6181521-Pleurochrysis_carterae.AAC.1